MDAMYTGALVRLATGALDWAAADLRVLLLESGYTFDADHDFVADLSGELAAANYVRKTLAGTDVVRGSGRAELVASTLVWADLGVDESVQAAVVFEHDADDEAARLVAYLDVGVALNGNALTVGVDPTGLLRLT